MKTITCNRHTKFGFGYTSGCIQTDHGLVVAEVDKPDYTGTIKQVSKMINEDLTLKSFASGGTYYRNSWFVKLNGKWYKINAHEVYNHPLDLQLEDETGYLYNSIELEIEE